MVLKWSNGLMEKKKEMLMHLLLLFLGYVML